MAALKQPIFQSNKNLPKLELHAHLNGSLSKECLQKLSKLKADSTNPTFNLSAFDDLQSCFDVFAIAHSLTDTTDAVKLATKYCIREFAEDNVVYLELRSTPRATETMSKKDYINAIIDGIKESAITTTLIISINRERSVEEALENVNLAIEIMQTTDNIVVGIDLCGNPAKGKFADFVPVLKKARQNNLKITLHCGEIDNHPEVMEMINFHPDRLSHVTCLQEEAVDKIKILKIPIELCVTSNLKCKTVGSVKEHQFKIYRDDDFILGTDDKGVFETNLSNEYDLVQEAFNLKSDCFWNMNENAIKFCFASSHVKEKLLEIFKKARLEI